MTATDNIIETIKQRIAHVNRCVCVCNVTTCKFLYKFMSLSLSLICGPPYVNTSSAFMSRLLQLAVVSTRQLSIKAKTSAIFALFSLIAAMNKLEMCGVDNVRCHNQMIVITLKLVVHEGMSTTTITAIIFTLLPLSCATTTQ